MKFQKIKQFWQKGRINHLGENLFWRFISIIFMKGFNKNGVWDGLNNDKNGVDFKCTGASLNVKNLMAFKKDECSFNNSICPLANNYAAIDFNKKDFYSIQFKKDFMKIVKALFLVVVSLVITISCTYSQDLPLIISKARPDTTPIMVVISDQGEWTPFEEDLHRGFMAINYPFIGLNSNRYFEVKKTPQQAVKDLAPVLRKYAADWQRGKIILIGNGFGAEVLPFIYDQLPEDIKNKVVKMVLIAPQRSSDFQVHQHDLHGNKENNYAYNVPYQISKIKTIPIVCIWKQNDNAFYTEKNKPSNIILQLYKDKSQVFDARNVVKLAQ